MNKRFKGFRGLKGFRGFKGGQTAGLNPHEKPLAGLFGSASLEGQDGLDIVPVPSARALVSVLRVLGVLKVLGALRAANDKRQA